MVLLTKVTCSYSEVEDRIRMSAMVKDGEPVVFWMTQRLCNRLVRELTGHLGKLVSQSTMIETGLLLSCYQRNAEWQHEPSTPVGFGEASLQILPEKVLLSCSAESVALLFPLIKDENAQLQLSLKELRQWMAIVYRAYQNAGWPMDAWPEWFTRPKVGRN